MSLSVEIKNCARCGGHHRTLYAIPLSGLIEGPRTHYCVCPSTEQPIYIDPAKPNGDEPVKATAPPEEPAKPPESVKVEQQSQTIDKRKK